MTQHIGKLFPHPVGVLCIFLEPPKYHIMKHSKCLRLLLLAPYLWNLVKEAGRSGCGGGCCCCRDVRVLLSSDH